MSVLRVRAGFGQAKVASLDEDGTAWCRRGGVAGAHVALSPRAGCASEHEKLAFSLRSAQKPQGALSPRWQLGMPAYTLSRYRSYG